MYLRKFGGEKPTGSEDSSEKNDFTAVVFLIHGYFENEVTLQIRSRSPKSYQLFILPK